MLGSAWMKKTTMRSSRSHRQGEGWPVATGTAIGVGELARSSSCSCGREGKVGEGERVGHAACVASSGRSRGRRQAGGGRGACLRVVATRLSSSWREVEGDWHCTVGWATQ